MKRLFPILCALLLCCPAWGAIARQGACSGTTSCTPSSAAVGAVEYAFVYRTGSTAGATVPSGWTTVATYSESSGDTPGVMRIACRVDMSATAATSGTFANATNLGIVSYIGTGARSTSDCNLSLIPIGGSSNNNAQTSTTVSYNGVTMSDSSGNSWVIAAQGNSSSSNTCTPSSLTNVASATTGDIGVSDSNGGTISFATSTCSVRSSTWVTAVLEIVVHQAQAAIPSQVFEVYGSMSNLTDANNESNNFTWIAANPSPSGNTVAFAINWSFPSGCSSAATCRPTITDDKSNPYTDIEDCTNTNHASGTSVFYSAGVAAGTQKFVINFSGYGNVIQNFHFSYINLKGIATTSPIDGQNCSIDTFPSANSYDNVAPGSITTTTNGDIIWATVNSQYSPGGGALQDVVAHSGFALLTAGNNLYDSAQEIIVQSAAGVINPGFGMMEGPGDEYDYYGATVVAFKTDSSKGSGYSGIHILTEQQVAMRATSPQTFVFPSSGNLMVIAEDTQGALGSAVVGTMPTSPVWTVLSAAATYDPMITYSANATQADSSTIVYITVNNADQIPENTYLINVVGAAANQPDPSATCGGSSTSLGAGTGSCSNSGTQITVGQTTGTISNSQTNIPFTANTTCTNGTLAILDDGTNAETVLINSGCGTSTLSVTRADGTAAYYFSTAIAHSTGVYMYAVPFSDGPTITPSASNGLVIAEMNTGIGPPASSTNCGFNQTWYPGMTDGSYLSYGDGHCNVYPTSASAINIGWSFQNGLLISGGSGSGWDALATSFLPGPGGLQSQKPKVHRPAVLF